VAHRLIDRGEAASSIIRNSFFTAAARGIQIATSYLVAVAVARYLTIRDYGEYSFIAALVASAMSLSYFGIQQVLIREIARDRENAGSYIGAASLLRSVLSAVAIVSLLTLGPFLDLSPLAKRAVLIAVLGEFFLAFSMLTRSIFQAYEKMVYEPLLALLGSLTLAAGVGAAIVLDLGLLWLFGAAAVANAVQFATGACLLRKKIVRPTSRLTPQLVKTFFKHAAVIGVGVFLSMNLFRVNVFLLKALSTIEEVAVFQLPHNLVIQLQVLPYALVTAIFPVFSRLIHEDPARVAGIFEKLFRYLLVFSLFAALGLSLFASEILAAIFGGKYASSVPVLAVVAWSLAPLSLDMVLNSMLVAMNKQKYSIYYAGVAICVNIVGGLLVLPRYGAFGAAFLSLFSYCIMFACSFSLVARQGFRISLPGLARDIGLALAAATAVMATLKPLSAAAAAAAGTLVYFGLLRLRRVVLPAEVRMVRNAARNILTGGAKNKWEKSSL